jgi:hypothetical protein
MNQNVVITTCLMGQELVGRKHLQQIQKLMKKQLPQKKRDFIIVGELPRRYRSSATESFAIR